MKKMILTLLLVISTLFSISVMADPLPPNGIPVEITQPDGTPISARMFGDEFFGYVATSDSYTIMQNTQDAQWYYVKMTPDGTDVMMSDKIVGKDYPLGIEKMTLPPANTIRAKRNTEFMKQRGVGLATVEREKIQRKIYKKESLEVINEAITGFNKKYTNEAPMALVTEKQLKSKVPMEPPPVFGQSEVVGLVVLAKFKDETELIPRQEIDNLFNKENYSNARGGNCSVRDYFYDQSLGKVTFTNVVTDYYTMPKTRKEYLDSPDGSSVFVNDIMQLLNADESLDAKLETVTAQGDREIALSFLYNGERPTTWAGPLWPHASWGGLSGKYIRNKRLWGYQMSDISSSPTIGVYAHELGHLVFTFVDYYDYGYYDNYRSQGIGAHCIMSSGSYNNGSNTPAPINGYLRLSLGWLEAQELNQTEGRLVVNPNSNIIYKHPKNDDPREYYLIEGRLMNNNNKYHDYLPGEGLVIWHVDEAKSGTEEQDRSPTKHYELSLVQADGKYDLETANGQSLYTDYYDGSTLRNCFNNETTPPSVWWNGNYAGFSLNNIAISESRTSITADYFASPTVKTPLITPPTKSYSDGIEVTISCETEGVDIFYSVDGFDPDTSATSRTFKYVNKFSPPTAGKDYVIVKAIATKNGFAPSQVATVVYSHSFVTFIYPTEGLNINASDNIILRFIPLIDMTSIAISVVDENGKTKQGPWNMDVVRDSTNNGDYYYDLEKLNRGEEYHTQGLSTGIGENDPVQRNYRIKILPNGQETAASYSPYFNVGMKQTITTTQQSIFLNTDRVDSKTATIIATATTPSPNTPITYKSENSSIATVNGSGIVTAVAPGFTRIQLNKLGGLAERKAYFDADTVYIDVQVQSDEVITQSIIADNIATFVDSKVTLPAHATSFLPLTFESLHTNIATIDVTTGEITPKSVGEATIVITQAGNSYYKKVTKEITVYVYEKIVAETPSEPTPAGVVIQWNIAPGIPCNIFRSETENGNFNYEVSRNNTLGRFTDTTAIPGKRYWYKVELAAPIQITNP